MQAVRRACRRFAKQQLTDEMDDRALIRDYIDARAFEGKVAVVFGCLGADGTQWDNQIKIVPATVTHVTQWVLNNIESDTLQWFELQDPRDVTRIKPSNRDIA
jgi:hypothetical protein